MAYHSYTIGSKVYPLTDEQFKDVNDRDLATPHTAKGDAEFTDWLKQYVKDNKISPEKIQRAEQGTGYWHKGWGGGYSDESIKLARILQSMNSLISVMNPSRRPRATYADTSTSYWMGEESNSICLPVNPAKELDEESAVNVETGFAVHEVHHSTETSKIMKNYAIRELFERDQWDKQILNVIEDVRIDAISNKKYPGTKKNNEDVLDYLAPADEVFNITDEWFEANSNNRFRTLLMGTRYPDKWDATTQTDPKYTQFVDKLRSIVEDYKPLTGNDVNEKNILDTIANIKSLLRLDDSEFPTQETLKIMVCGSVQANIDGNGHNQHSAEAAEAEQLAEEDVQVINDNEIRSRYLFPEGQQGPAKIIITKPKGDGLRKVNANSSLLAKAKAALLFRRAIPQNDTRLQRSGELDEDELYRFGFGDYRVFKDAQVQHKPDTFVGLLIDVSGSMAGLKTQWAMQMANLLLIAVQSKANVKGRVWAHTSGGNDEAYFYRIWEEGDSQNRLSLLHGHLPSGANYDSYAVAWAGDEIARENTEQKLLLVISDGLPAETNYGEGPARDHVRYHVDRLERKGVDVIQIAIDEDLRPDNQAQMYKRWIPFQAGGDQQSAFSKTLKELTKVLEKL